MSKRLNHDSNSDKRNASDIGGFKFLDQSIQIRIMCVAFDKLKYSLDKLTMTMNMSELNVTNVSWNLCNIPNDLKTLGL